MYDFSKTLHSKASHNILMRFSAVHGEEDTWYSLTGVKTMYLCVGEVGKCVSSQVELVFSLPESPAQTSQDRISLPAPEGASLGMAGVGELSHCLGEGVTNALCCWPRKTGCGDGGNNV